MSLYREYLLFIAGIILAVTIISSLYRPRNLKIWWFAVPIVLGVTLTDLYLLASTGRNINARFACWIFATEDRCGSNNRKLGSGGKLIERKLNEYLSKRRDYIQDIRDPLIIAGKDLEHVSSKGEYLAIYTKDEWRTNIQPFNLIPRPSNEKAILKKRAETRFPFDFEKIYAVRMNGCPEGKYKCLVVFADGREWNYDTKKWSKTKSIKLRPAPLYEVPSLRQIVEAVYVNGLYFDPIFLSNKGVYEAQTWASHHYTSDDCTPRELRPHYLIPRCVIFEAVEFGDKNSGIWIDRTKGMSTVDHNYRVKLQIIFGFHSLIDD